MPIVDRFELKEDHIKLLTRANVWWCDWEFGAPGLDPKRPYGNSSVIMDIAEIIGLEIFEDYDGERHLSEEQYKLCKQLHSETEKALQIVLSTQSFEPGVYECDDYVNWTKIKEDSANA